MSTSVWGKETSAILEFYFLFRFRLYYRNRHVILHQLLPNRTTHCGNMTSYRFSRWQPRPLSTTSGFLFVHVAAFRRPKSISKPNFVQIHQFTIEITTSVLEKQTSAILEFYFRFHFRPFHRNRRVTVRQAAEFRPN